MNRKLLKAAVNAMNQVPNMRLSGEFRDSYALCSAIDKELAQPAVVIEKLFFVDFDSGYYVLNEDVSYKVVGIENFSDENGYSEEEKQEIDRLMVCDRVAMDSGYQSVIRVR